MKIFPQFIYTLWIKYKNNFYSRFQLYYINMDDVCYAERKKKQKVSLNPRGSLWSKGEL